MNKFKNCYLQVVTKESVCILVENLIKKKSKSTTIKESADNLSNCDEKGYFWRIGILGV